MFGDKELGLCLLLEKELILDMIQKKKFMSAFMEEIQIE